MKLNRLILGTVLAGMIGPVLASPYCIAVNGGFGNGGTTYIARNFTLPDASKCEPWTGYTKTSTTVIAITSGVACLSGDSTVMTVSVSSADPSYFGNQPVADYIQFCPGGANGCPIGGGQDV